MAVTRPNIAELDPVWHRIRQEAEEAILAEPLMGGLIHSGVLHHASFERALAYRISLKLASNEMSEQILRETADEAYIDDPELTAAARADLGPARLVASEIALAAMLFGSCRATVPMMA